MLREREVDNSESTVGDVIAETSRTLIHKAKIQVVAGDVVAETSRTRIHKKAKIQMFKLSSICFHEIKDTQRLGLQEESFTNVV
jgi:Ni2+-binding GTPase involved in maturation of urease and hydrogenase